MPTYLLCLVDHDLLEQLPRDALNLTISALKRLVDGYSAHGDGAETFTKRSVCVHECCVRMYICV